MYQVILKNYFDDDNGTYILHDLRSDDLILHDLKLELESNTCGACSFTIYPNHPYFDRIKKMRSIITVIEDGETIFKGRIFSDTIDFDNSKSVNAEGILSFLNDSVISPFTFNTTNNAVYSFLLMVLNSHNSQVQPFQQFHIGNVTVTSNNSNEGLYHASENYITSWECLSERLFGSSLGGYLCIRYEENGNYIDYLADFTEYNNQIVEFGENLLNLTRDTTATDSCSAVLPIGKDKLTIQALTNGDINSDLVKSGKVIYSKNALKKYGYICAVQEWSEIVNAETLKNNAVKWLNSVGANFSNTITVNAVDLHFSDESIASLRINKKTYVNSAVHGLQNAVYNLTKLSVDLLNPQNTVITFGKTYLSFVDGNRVTTNSKISSFENNIRNILYGDDNLVKSSEYNEYKNSVSTVFTQIQNDIKKCINLVDEEVIIGTGENTVTLTQLKNALEKINNL